MVDESGGKPNWAFNFEGTTADAAAAITAETGTVEKKARISMQNLVDLANFAVPPATHCSFASAQTTTKNSDGSIKRQITIGFTYTNQQG
jgi:hypothetical protein